MGSCKAGFLNGCLPGSGFRPASGEELRWPATPTLGGSRQRLELVDHEPAEGVLLEDAASNRFVHLAQVSDREGVAQQSVGVRMRPVLPTQAPNREFDDRKVVVGQSQPNGKWHDASARRVSQPFKLWEREHVKVCHGQDPAAVVSLRVVEDMELLWFATSDSSLLVKGSAYGVGESLAPVQERARQGPAGPRFSGLRWAANEQDAKLRRLAVSRRDHRHERGVDRDRGPGIVGEGAARFVAKCRLPGHLIILSDPCATVFPISAVLI